MKTITYNYIKICLLAIYFSMISCKTEQIKLDDSTSDNISEHTKIQAVEVVNPEKRSFIADVLVSGTAEANQKVILYAMISGYIQNIYKDIGDVVHKGDIIAELVNPDILGQYEEKKVQLDAKKAIYERLKYIHKNTPSLTPLQMVESAESEYLTINSSINTIKNKLEFLHIKAPFAGKITKRMVDNGALIQSGLTEDNPQGIVEIQDINPIRLIVHLPESDIAAIGKGMEVNVTFPELPGESFKTKVSRIAGALDPDSKTMQIEIDINNTKEIIKPGMYAKVLMQISNRKDVISLPVTAQWIFQNQSFVLIVNGDKVERIPLRKGLSNKDYFEVLNPEITENSLVIIQGKGLVQPGQLVKPIIKSK